MLPVDAFTLPHVRRRGKKERREKREEKGRREGGKGSLKPHECFSARLAVFGRSKPPKGSEASGGPGTVVQISWNPPGAACSGRRPPQPEAEDAPGPRAMCS